MVNISKIDENKVTVILDGNSIAYRAFYKAPPLKAGDMPTGVIHVFLSVMDKIRSNPQVGEVLAVFDAKGKNRRHELLTSYKATRPAMPDDLIVQIEALKEIIPITGTPLYSISGYEADDVIFTLTQNISSDVWIVTKDKDLYQLVKDRVKIYDYQTDTLIDSEKVFEKFGLYPEHILDMLALMGDSSDNIPGVAGIGPKTAVSLIQTYGSLDKVYENISQIKGKIQEKLINEKEMAFLSREIATLMNVDGLPKPESKRDENKLYNIFKKLQLKSHLNKLLLKKDEIKNETITEIFTDEVNKELIPLEDGVVKIPIIIAYLDDNIFVCDDKFFEEYNEHPIPKYCYDIKNLIKKGVDVGESFDLMLLYWLNDPDSGSWKIGKDESWANFLARLVSTKNETVKRLQDLGLEELYYKMELPIARILAKAEMEGIFLDRKQIANVADNLKSEVNNLIAKICNRANTSLNPNSPKQLGVYLYETLGMKPQKKNKRGYSTDEDALKDLITVYPDKKDVIEDILKYRELNKILSTYTLNLLEYRDADGRVRTDFKQTGTATGRLSSANPNLQNIPQRSDVSKAIRGAFCASDGKIFVAIDYSQIELRILAHLSEDNNLISSFMDGADIHSITAKNLFHLPSDAEVSADYRRIAKAVNFGILYGLSSYGLSRDTGIFQSDAKTFIEKYFKLYPGVNDFVAGVITKTCEKGYCETILGRKRFIRDITSKNVLVRQRAERAAINAPVQGSAADIIKLAMIECDKYINTSGIKAKLLLQIHDELLFEVDNGDAEIFAAEAQRIMETVFVMKVPLAVNCKMGKSWGDL